MLSVPQSTNATVSGNAFPSATCRAISCSARAEPSFSANGLGTLYGSNPYRLRPVGSTAVLRTRSAAGAAVTKRPSSARSMPGISPSTARSESTASRPFSTGSSDSGAKPARSASRRPAPTLPEVTVACTIARAASSRRSADMAARDDARSVSISGATSASGRPAFAIASSISARSATDGVSPTICRPTGINACSTSSSLSRTASIAAWSADVHAGLSCASSSEQACS